MPQSIIRYRTKPGQADANADLVRAVYAELHRTRPGGFRYTTLRAFGEFQAGIRERCDEPPVAQAYTEVGSYRFFTG